MFWRTEESVVPPEKPPSRIRSWVSKNFSCLPTSVLETREQRRERFRRKTPKPAEASPASSRAEPAQAAEAEPSSCSKQEASASSHGPPPVVADVVEAETRPCSSDPPAGAAVQHHPPAVARVGPVEEDEPDPFAALDVGFAQLELLRASHAGQQHALYFLALDGYWEPQGMLALLEFIEEVMEAPWAASGVLLIYDLRNAGLYQLEILSDLLSWVDEDQERQDLWRKRCVGCKIVVSAGAHVMLVRKMLAGVFYIYPPPCNTYLATSPMEPMRDEDMCYEAPKVVGNGGVVPIMTDDCKSKVPFDCGQNVSSPMFAASITAASVPASVGGPVGAEEVVELPPFSSLDVGFGDIEQGYDEASSLGFLRLNSRDGEVTRERVEELLKFIDRFTRSQNAVNGWKITYDLRCLRIPSMSLVQRLAEWGAEDVRKERFEKLHKETKIVLSSGIKFAISKSILCAFFTMSPPVSKTFLVTDPDEDESNATFFEPRIRTSTAATDDPARS